MDNADKLIMTWIQECERGMLEMAYIDLLHSYRKLKEENKSLKEKYLTNLVILDELESNHG